MVFCSNVPSTKTPIGFDCPLVNPALILYIKLAVALSLFLNRPNYLLPFLEGGGLSE